MQEDRQEPSCPGPGRPPAAVLFDLDGTLVDSEALHARSALEVLAEAGVRDLGEEALAGYVGWPELPFWEDLRRRFGLQAGAAELAARRTTRLLELFRDRGARPLPGARSLLEALERAGIPCAVASSSPRAQLEAALEGAGLRSFLKVLVSGHEDVPRSKPHPDCYLEAARRLGVESERCLAVEDSATGARAAREAGCFVVLVPCPSHPEKDRSAAHRVLPDLGAVQALLGLA